MAIVPHDIRTSGVKFENVLLCRGRAENPRIAGLTLQLETCMFDTDLFVDDFCPHFESGTFFASRDLM